MLFPENLFLELCTISCMLKYAYRIAPFNAILTKKI
jgi:hypothetical protein